MSSHREAPEISKDPAADNTDVYAFVSPDKPDFVTIIANYIPLQKPDGGPNFYEFADDVSYQIHISNSGDALSDVIYEFRFKTTVRNPDTFLYNTGPITSIDSPNWNRPQHYTVTRTLRTTKKTTTLGSNLAVPPVNVGVRSTPDYADTFNAASIHSLGGGRQVFAGQRADAFFVDLGAIFDLGALRPFEHLHLIPSADAAGKNSVQACNVHTIAIQVPITEVTKGNVLPKNVKAATSVIGVWATASRQRSRTYDDKTHDWINSGAFRQVSRLGNPLFNEVIVPMSKKDLWNKLPPSKDSAYEEYVVTKNELAGLLPVLYPGVFPNLKAYTKPRVDLGAVLLTGVPNGIIPGFQNYTGSTSADMLRLNLAIPPKQAEDSSASIYGILGNDLAGYPNGRRVTDDIVAISLRAVAGAALHLVDPSFTPDGAAAILKDGTTQNNGTLLPAFPYLGTPNGGYSVGEGTPGGFNDHTTPPA